MLRQILGMEAPVLVLALLLMTQIAPTSADKSSCTVKAEDCLSKLSSISCAKNKLLQSCLKAACTPEEVADIEFQICETHNFLSQPDKSSVNHRCKSKYKLCKYLVSTPIRLYLNPHAALKSACGSMHTQEVRNCIVANLQGCTEQEYNLLAAHACNPYVLGGVLPVTEKCKGRAEHCRSEIKTLKCNDAATSKCLEESGLCIPDEVVYLTKKLCESYNFLKDITENSTLYYDYCTPHLEKCIKNSKSLSLHYFSPTMLKIHFCYGINQDWEECITQEGLECTVGDFKKMIEIICSPPENPEISDECLAHTRYCLTTRTRRSCKTIMGTYDCLRDGCDEAEAQNVIHGACEDVYHQGAFAMKMSTLSQQCQSGIGTALTLILIQDFYLLMPKERIMNLCWGLLSERAKSIIQNPTKCSDAEYNIMTHASCSPKEDHVTDLCRKHAATCIAQLDTCEAMESIDKCLKVFCTGSELRYLKTETCKFFSYKKKLTDLTSTFSDDCINSIKQCAPNLEIMKRKWYNQRDAMQRLCQVVNTKFYMDCVSYEFCTTDDLKMFRSAACVPPSTLYSPVSAGCAEGKSSCLGSLGVTSCHDIYGVYGCLQQRCNDDEVSRVLFQACQFITDYGSFMAQTLPTHMPPKCNITIMLCIGPKIKELLNYVKPVPFCQIITNKQVTDCINKNQWCAHPMQQLKDLACNINDTAQHLVSPVCMEQGGFCKERMTERTCEQAYNMEDCLSGECSGVENENIRRDLCRTIAYLDHVLYELSGRSQLCQERIKFGCLQRSLPKGQTWHSYIDIRFRLCQVVNSQEAKTCLLQGGECTMGEYESLLIDTCSPPEGGLTGLDPDCITTSTMCLIHIEQMSCDDVMDIEDCLSSKCTPLEIRHIQTGACDTLDYIGLLDYEAGNVGGQCSVKLTECFNVSTIPYTIWSDHHQFKRRACQLVFSLIVEECLSEACRVSQMDEFVKIVCQKVNRVAASKNNGLQLKCRVRLVLMLIMLFVGLSKDL